MITLEDVKRGYERGVVRFVDGAKFYGDGIVCRIGYDGWVSNWFYFGGEDAEDYTDPDKFINDVGLDNALEWVTDALNDCIKEIDEDEYAFYKSVLAECR